MKPLKIYSLLFISTLFFSASSIAKNITENNVPATVLSAFAAKYPKATIKNWNTTDGEYYIAKAKEDNHKYFAVFDNKGNWIKTTTKLNWPWTISPEVKKAFKKTKYGTLHIYAVNIVEKPSGQFFQLMVDDANPNPDKFQNLQTVNWLLEFKSNGELVEESNTNTPPLL